MSNEQYLIVSYFTVGLLVLGIACLTYLLLRRSFIETTKNLPQKRFSYILKRAFPLCIIFTALAGFLSVSFRSCEKDTYNKIIEDRAYLVLKNQEQLLISLSCIVIALLVAAILMLGILIIIKQHNMNKRN